MLGWIAINKMKSKLHYAEQFHNVLEKETTLRWTVPQCIRKGNYTTLNSSTMY